MSSLLIRGAHVVTEPARPGGGVIENGAVLVEGDRISVVGSFDALRASNPGAKIIGSGDDIVIPGLIDAHSHSRGLSPMQKGGGYDFLENAFLDWSTMVYLPNRLCAALSAVRHLRYGCTTLHHTGWNDEGPTALPEARDALNAYASVGMRVAYSPGVRNRNKFCVGEEDFITRLPADLADWVRPQISYDRQKIEEDFFALFEALYSGHDGPMSRVFFGPSWAHGTTEPFFRRIHDRAAALGNLPIHIHTLQTPHQRAYGFMAHGKSLVSYLDDLGLLTPATTLGHAVWLSEADIALLAARGTGTTHHPSCNLHVRNGISPIHPMIRGGVRVAIGIDDKSINDDDDILMELRLAHMLSRVPGFDLGNSIALAPHEILALGTTNAATSIGFAGQIGALKAGMKADIVLLDREEMTRDPWQSTRLPIPELVLMRGKGAHTKTVIVNGQVVMEDRRFTSYDVEALYAEVRDYVTHFEAKDPDPVRLAMLRALKPHFHAWHSEVLTHLDVTKPHYAMNGKR